jgi:hypothetical protein
VSVEFEVITVVNVKNALIWDVAPRESYKTDVSEEGVDSIFRLEKFAIEGNHERKETLAED